MAGIEPKHLPKLIAAIAAAPFVIGWEYVRSWVVTERRKRRHRNRDTDEGD